MTTLSGLANELCRILDKLGVPYENKVSDDIGMEEVLSMQALAVDAYRTRILEGYYLQWIGEMEMFRHNGGMEVYMRYKKILAGWATEEMLKGQAFGL